MNKAQLVDAIAKKTGFTKKDMSKAVDVVFDTITEVLSRGEKVSVVGFGTFETRSRAARKGRNPQTGREIRIKARRVPAFRAGKNLKSAISG